MCLGGKGVKVVNGRHEVERPAMCNNANKALMGDPAADAALMKGRMGLSPYFRVCRTMLLHLRRDLVCRDGM